jgi:hypothetical protein
MGTVGYEQEIVEVPALDGDEVLAEAAFVARARSSSVSRALPAHIVTGDQDRARRMELEEPLGQ